MKLRLRDTGITFHRHVRIPCGQVFGNVSHYFICKNTFKEKISIAKGSEYFLRNLDDNLLKKAKVKGPTIIDYRK